MAIFLFAFLSSPKNPKGIQDKEWLISFSMVLLIWFTAVHAIAYLPTMIFGGLSGMCEAISGRAVNAYQNWRDYQYAAAIIVLIVVIYPFALFFYLIYDGFNPYDELTAQQLRLEGNFSARLCYIMRVCFHLFMLVTTVYLVFVLLIVGFIRTRQTSKGQYFWIA